MNTLRYMQQAIGIAFSNIGKTSPNPSVGAIIVNDDRIISTGSTCAYGCDHAEVDALKSATENPAGADLYVSLEPCSIHGNTPPCTDRIIQAGIKRVYVPLLDPNPLVNGNGLRTLREAGIDVIVIHEMAPAAGDIIRHFAKSIIHKKGFLVHKSALTLDGRTATNSGDSQWISSEYSRYITHRLRSMMDAIIIGKGTLLHDNPRLNARMDSFPPAVIEYFHRSPVLAGRDNMFLRFLLDSSVPVYQGTPLRVIVGLPSDFLTRYRVFQHEHFLLFINTRELSSISTREDYPHLKKLMDTGAILVIPYDNPLQQAAWIMEQLHMRGKIFSMIEGGSRLAGSFWDARLVDQVFYAISPRLLGSGLPVADGTIRERIADATRLTDVSTMLAGDDVLYTAYSAPLKECLCLPD